MQGATNTLEHVFSFGVVPLEGRQDAGNSCLLSATA